ncbi:hypothetical protein SeMB42_g05527 [Synchytrium endobioticum]|uniref:Phospholipid scramblase n=1 Tax=Synchytrium endobioticum TaxID=286115 RepID=A0A507CJ25_9FUNG|nr:hypothetical protein SeLEV6574_g07024 [Synchytrium endobioticum]TPX41548.1 hypothetical protein SeMB42_g05527 [Synchytrium endobioticum]
MSVYALFQSSCLQQALVRAEYKKATADHQTTPPSPDSNQAPSIARCLSTAPTTVVARQLEMLNLFIGYEQANKYAIKTPQGLDIGFIAEEETAFTGIIMRQILRTRRPVKAVILDAAGNIVLKVSRPIKWFLNSKLFVHDASDNLIGEVQQVWHLWRRKYDVFLGKKQFAHIDTGFWGWDFFLRDESARVFAAIQRQFGGLAREVFTDTGEYVVRMDGMEGQSASDLSLNERAVVLGTAINIDFDYFSRHSNSHGGMGLPFFSPDHNNNHDETSTVPTTASQTPSTSLTGPGMPIPMPIIIPGAFGGAAPKSGGGDMLETSQHSPSQESQPSSSVDGNTPPHYPYTEHQQEPQHPTNQWGDEVAPSDDSPFLSDDQVFGPSDSNSGDKDGFDEGDWL